MHSFKDGQKVKMVTWPDDSTLTSEAELVSGMEISMEYGHMANIAFVKINYSDGTVGMEYTGNCFVVLEKGGE